MNRKIRIALCSMIFAFSLTLCLALTDREKTTDVGEAEPVCTMAWWSTMYERPNPERLPVRVRWALLKGLE